MPQINLYVILSAGEESLYLFKPRDSSELKFLRMTFFIYVHCVKAVFFYFHKLSIFRQKWLFWVVFVYLAQFFRHFLAKYILRKLYCRGIIQPFVFWAALHYFITAYCTYPFYKDSITTKKGEPV